MRGAMIRRWEIAVSVYPWLNTHGRLCQAAGHQVPTMVLEASSHTAATMATTEEGAALTAGVTLARMLAVIAADMVVAQAMVDVKMSGQATGCAQTAASTCLPPRWRASNVARPSRAVMTLVEGGTLVVVTALGASTMGLAEGTAGLSMIEVDMAETGLVAGDTTTASVMMIESVTMIVGDMMIAADMTAAEDTTTVGITIILCHTMTEATTAIMNDTMKT